VRVLIVFVSLMLIMLIWSCAEEKTPTASVTHPAGWNELKSDVFHGDKVKAVGLESCHQCHGRDYLGGSSGSSCYECHSESNGMEACNLCHGNSSASVLNIASWAPPEDLMKDTSTTVTGVGAHQIHLTGITWSTGYTRNCDLCHTPLTGFDDPNHIDKQEGINIRFGEIGIWPGEVAPRWDHNAESCNNIYCHGNFAFMKSASANPWAYQDTAKSIRGNGDNEMIWTEVGSGQADCGTCHGLPPTGHLAVEAACSACHGSVVGVDNSIIDKSRHINGRIDLN
jgi:hypothetical protein